MYWLCESDEIAGGVKNYYSNLSFGDVNLGIKRIIEIHGDGV